MLVTGGTGGLGRLIARHLVNRHGVRDLILASRSGPDAPGIADLVAELGEAGARVAAVRCDVADRGALAGLIAAIPAERPLTGVVHAAGVLNDGMITSLTGERLDSVYRSKVDGAWHLHELTRDLPVTAFVLFSAFAGLAGGPGQANYAAANAAVNAIAQRRRDEDCPRSRSPGASGTSRPAWAAGSARPVAAG
ncbi:SDR family NAD(P)-dependent oxidoreductase [Phytohabitans flavus]